ncbi:FISUMP domain-containing protein [Fibrobacter sp. UWB12]|uniref:FISUMP domain-containing protein n=1 Tax=Fibrobacter sp. UWB12 TaxID=1896203 RepID=UPI000917B849|nr:FISUMP domain-containing protein [Fibrobacter sp. UWB12]SHK52638.1 major paralogous domain-containing protein [Fibrobacter sp. UWB12]
MNKKYALAIATSLLAAESVFADPSGDKTVVACGFDDMFGNSCYWRCPDMEDTFRTEKKDDRCANVLFRCANYPRSFMRSSVGSSEIWITPDKYNYYFGKLPQEYDCSISEEERAAMSSRPTQPPPANPYAANKYQNTSTYDESKNLLIDNRDGERYMTVKIGGRVWMAENLKFRLPESYCYDGVTQNCETYGRLYTWNAAKQACPDGWSLPMGDDLNYQDFNLNSFRVLDGGYYVDGERYIDLGNRAFFWLGDDKGGDRADAMSFRGTNLETFAFQGRKANGYSVRCIQNWEAACKERLGGVMDNAGKTYRTLKIGDQTWMAEDVILDRLDEMEARNLNRACPRGWHVPEQYEYEQLFSKASEFEIRANDKRMKSNRDTKENPCSLNFDFKRGYWTASKNGNEMTYVDWKYNAIREKGSPYFKHGDAYTNKLRCVKNAPSYAAPKPTVTNTQAAPAPSAPANSANKTVLEKFILQGVTFGVGQSRFTKESSEGLRRLADHLRNYQGKTIEIVSHTDNLDRPERSRVLALKRAEEVKSYLVNAGLQAKDVIATGKGGDEPLVPNTTPDNRMKNNRIEVFVYSYDQPGKAASAAPKQNQNNVQKSEPAPKKCKERDMANAKLGECYSYTDGTKDHRRCMAAYKNLLNLANTKCK